MADPNAPTPQADASLVAKAETQAPNTILPPGKTPPELLVQIVKKRAYQTSRIAIWDFLRFRKAELYDECKQWLRPAMSTSDAGFTNQWSEVEFSGNDNNAIPLPVYNEGVLLRENESARLGRPEYKPKVRAKSDNPGIKEKEGAKGAERALSSRLKDMWTAQEDLFYLHPPLYGGVWLESRWDQTWLDTVKVPVPALCCPRHPRSGVPLEQTPMAQPVPAGPGPLAGAGIESILKGQQTEETEPEQELVEPQDDLVEADEQGVPLTAAPPQPCDFTCAKPGSEKTQLSMGQPNPQAPGADGTCPMCSDHPQLIPYQPTMQEALDNPELGREVPKGDWYMSVRTPYSIFPRDAGIGVDPTDVDEWVYCHIETLEWCEQRYPDKVRDLSTGDLRIHPENPATLMAANPTLGNPQLLRHAATLGVFKTSVIVYEYNRKPWLEWNVETKRYEKNRGRHIVVAGTTVCLDDHLLVESLNSPGTYVPRVRIEFVPWEFRDGGRRSTVGQSLWDRLFDPQDTLNERVSQIRAVNQRGALPWYLQARGMNFETRAADASVPFRRVLADIDPTSNQPPLALMQNTTIDPGVYNEINVTLQHMAKQQVEVERGQVPPGVAAATAIAYLKTESGEKRRPRIKRLKNALIRAWDHGVKLMSSFYIEERPYSYQDESGEERHAFIHGAVIAASNPKVDIYPTPDYDVTDSRREAIRDMVQLGILNPKENPELNRKIVKAMDEDSEFFVDDDLQTEQAQREWMYFQEEKRVPVIDPSLDDHLTHYKVHGRDCFSEWFRDAEDQCKWDEILGVIGGDWDDSLKQIAMQAAAPPPMPEIPPGLDLNQAAQFLKNAQMQPQPPKPSLQALVLAHWQQGLQTGGIQADMTPGGPLWNVLNWRAHLEAHRLTVEVNQMKAAPQVEAPGQGSSPSSPDQVQHGAAPAPEPPPQQQ
jgi:hypothetical protein